MYQPNPNRSQLLQFINNLNLSNLKPVQKIEDLASGVHYTHLLTHLAPQIVNINKCNKQAFHEHENIQNLKLLANSMEKMSVGFTFDLPKVAKRNYQENLNLLKNLYKLYFERKSKEEKPDDRSLDVGGGGNKNKKPLNGGPNTMNQRFNAPKVNKNFKPGARKEPLPKKDLIPQSLKNSIKKQEEREWRLQHQEMLNKLRQIQTIVDIEDDDQPLQRDDASIDGKTKAPSKDHQKLEKIKNILAIGGKRDQKKSNEPLPHENNHLSLSSMSSRTINTSMECKPSTDRSEYFSLSGKGGNVFDSSYRNLNGENSSTANNAFTSKTTEFMSSSRYDLRPTSYRKSTKERLGQGNRSRKKSIRKGTNFSEWVNEQNQQNKDEANYGDCENLLLSPIVVKGDVEPISKGEKNQKLSHGGKENKMKTLKKHQELEAKEQTNKKSSPPRTRSATKSHKSQTKEEKQKEDKLEEGAKVDQNQKQSNKKEGASLQDLDQTKENLSNQQRQATQSELNKGEEESLAPKESQTIQKPEAQVKTGGVQISEGRRRGMSILKKEGKQFFGGSQTSVEKRKVHFSPLDMKANKAHTEAQLPEASSGQKALQISQTKKENQNNSQNDLEKQLEKVQVEDEQTADLQELK